MKVATLKFYNTGPSLLRGVRPVRGEEGIRRVAFAPPSVPDDAD